MMLKDEWLRCQPGPCRPGSPEIWLDPSRRIQARVLLIIEDKLRELLEVLELISRVGGARALNATTAVWLSAKDPAEADIRELLHVTGIPDNPMAGAQVVVRGGREFNLPRVGQLSLGALGSEATYADEVAPLLRGGGILVQDIVLPFCDGTDEVVVSRSLSAVAAIRGRLWRRPPKVILMSSQKLGFDLVDTHRRACGVVYREEGGPDRCYHKHHLSNLVKDMVYDLDRSFPYSVRTSSSDWSAPVSVGDRGSSDEEDVSSNFDLVLWETSAAKVQITGRALKAPAELLLTSREAQLASRLVRYHLRVRAAAHGYDEGPVRIDEFGAELAAEVANPAQAMAKVKKRLLDLFTNEWSDAIETLGGEYRFSERLSVAIVSPRSSEPKMP